MYSTSDLTSHTAIEWPDHHRSHRFIEQSNHGSPTLPNRSSTIDMTKKSRKSSLPQSLQFELMNSRISPKPRSTIGNTVEPGKIVTRAERERRKYLQSLGSAEQRIPLTDNDFSFGCLWHKIMTAAQPLLQELHDLFRMAQRTKISHRRDLDLTDHWHFFSFKPYILAFIFFLLTFGGLLVVVNYLLVVSRAAAQCSPLVSYIPVTYTVTQYVTPTTSTPAVYADIATSNDPSTSTSTYTLIVQLSEVSASPSVSPSTTGAYYYVVESGTTSWIDGSTPSSGQPMVTLTSTVYVYPSSVVVQTSTLDTATVTPPAYTSTTYIAPDSDTTSTITTTRIVTTTLQNVITLTRSSFTAVGSAGWNSSSQTGLFSTATGVPTTITGTMYWSSGTEITSTSLTTLTLTLTQVETSSVMPTLTSTVSVSTSTGATSLGAETTGTSSNSATSSSSTSSTVLSYGVINASFDVESSISGTTSPSSSPTSALSVAAFSVPSSSSAAASFQSTLSSSVLFSTGSTLSLATASSSAVLSPLSASTQAITSATSAAGSLSSSPGSSVAAASSSLSSASGIASSLIASVNSQVLTASPTPSSQSSSSLSYGSLSSSTSTLVISTTSVILPSSASGSNLASLISLASSASSTSVASTTSQLVSTQSSSIVSSTSTTSPTSTQASSVVSSASATPSVCGEYGNFTLTFDDLPTFSTTKNDTDITQAPPIFDGYHQFAFSDGYVYAPSSDEPFQPHSLPNLAVFLGNASDLGVNSTPSAMAPTSGMIKPGEFGDGSSSPVSAYWFNAYNVWLGCDNSGPEVCTYVMTAYVWNATAQEEQQMDTENVTTSACPGFVDCQLEQVNFPQTFTGMSGLQIQAYKGPDQVMFFMDDVSMGWYNNTCAAGLQRLTSQIGGTARARRNRVIRR